MLVILAIQEVYVGGRWSKFSHGKNVTLYLKKITKAKSAVSVSQVIECLPSKYEALDSVPYIMNK
jgi:hypothetical protein